MTSSGVPSATRCPPSSPAPGPRSMTKSAARDQRLALGERDVGEERCRFLDRQADDLRDRAAADLETERLRAQPGAATGRARPLGHEGLDLATDVLGLGLAVSPLEHRHDALEATLLVALENDVPHRFLQRLPGRLERELVPLGQDGQRLLEVRRLTAGPRRQRALLERALGVRHQALGIDLPAAAETRARSEE